MKKLFLLLAITTAINTTFAGTFNNPANHRVPNSSPDRTVYFTDDVAYVADITALQAYVRGTITEVYVQDLNTAGHFKWFSSGYSANGGTVFTATGGGYWVRQYSGVLNVRWFGAKGDGVTDDASAINATCTVATSLGGATVRVPRGQYIITQTIQVPSNVTFEGDGRGNTEIRIKDTLTTDTIASISAMQTIGDNITVRDLTINGNRQHQIWHPFGSANYGLAVSSTNTVVKNVEMMNVTANGTGVPLTASDVVFDHIFSHDNGKKGFHSGTVENITITNSSFYNNEFGTGIGIHQGAKKVTITNNRSFGNGLYGYDLGDSEEIPSYHLIFTGNTSYDNQSDGLVLEGRNISTADTVAKDSSYLDKKAIIANNLFINDVVQIIAARNVSFENNTLDGKHLLIQTCFNTDVKNNNFYPARIDYAIKVQGVSLPQTDKTVGDQINISGNRIVLDSSDYAVTISASRHVTYRDNVIQGVATSYPVRVYDNLETATVKTRDKIRMGSNTYADGYNNDVNDFAVNTTTSALSSSTLNSSYPAVPVGFRVICGSITSGGIIYTKHTGSVWLTTSATVTP